MDVAPERHDSKMEALARGFIDAWADPDLDRFVALMAEDIVLRQPVTPVLRGREAARAEFSRLMRWLPDMRGVVDRWAATDDTLLIAWRLQFTLGSGPYELRIVDRIVARDGLIAEREAYFDSLHFFLTVLFRPGAWLPYLRYRGYVPGG